MLEVVILYSSEWVDAWSAYLTAEVNVYKKQVCDRLDLYSKARRQTLWTDTHDVMASRRKTLWPTRHTRSLVLTQGHSSQGPALTKIQGHPHVGVGMLGSWGKDDGVVCEVEAVYFGGTATACLGVAGRGLPLCGKATTEIFKKVTE